MSRWEQTLAYAGLSSLDLSRLLGSTCGSAKPCARCGETIPRGDPQLEAHAEGASYYFHPGCVSLIRGAASQPTR